MAANTSHPRSSPRSSLQVFATHFSAKFSTHGHSAARLLPLARCPRQKVLQASNTQLLAHYTQTSITDTLHTRNTMIFSTIARPPRSYRKSRFGRLMPDPFTPVLASIMRRHCTGGSLAPRWQGSAGVGEQQPHAAHLRSLPWLLSGAGTSGNDEQAAVWWRQGRQRL